MLTLACFRSVPFVSLMPGSMFSHVLDVISTSVFLSDLYYLTVIILQIPSTNSRIPLHCLPFCISYSCHSLATIVLIAAFRSLFPHLPKISEHRYSPFTVIIYSKLGDKFSIWILLKVIRVLKMKMSYYWTLFLCNILSNMSWSRARFFIKSSYFWRIFS